MEDDSYFPVDPSLYSLYDMSTSNPSQYGWTNPRPQSVVPMQDNTMEIQCKEELGDLDDLTAVGRFFRAELNPDPGKEGETPYAIAPIQFERAIDVLNQDNPDAATLFRDYQDAADWRTTQCEVEEPPEDGTLPTTEAQDRACVKLLFKAFKSTSKALDNPPMIEPFIKQKHDNRRVEALCWDVLTAIKKRAESGPLLLAYAPEKASGNDNLYTFADRLDAVVEAFAEYKTICKHVFDAPYINTLVDDPIRAKNRVLSNKRLNAEKAKYMAAGKEARTREQEGSKVQHSAKRRRTMTRGTEDEDQSSATLAASSPGEAFTPPSRANGNHRNITTTPRGQANNSQPRTPASARSTGNNSHTPKIKRELTTPTQAFPFGGTASSFLTTADLSDVSYANLLPNRHAQLMNAYFTNGYMNTNSPWLRGGMFPSPSVPQLFTPSGYQLGASCQASANGYAGSPTSLPTQRSQIETPVCFVTCFCPEDILG